MDQILHLRKETHLANDTLRLHLREKQNIIGCCKVRYECDSQVQSRTDPVAVFGVQLTTFVAALISQT